jgi:cohesin complex subunit SA-1/2
MVRKSLGVDLVPHPRRRVGQKRPNALASQRLAMPGTPPPASQKGLKRMATRQTRTKFHKTSKSTQTTPSSVRVDCPSPFRVSHLFPCEDAIMNPSAALQSTVEDFLDSLKETPGAAQAELVNCILRACGCNETVNEDEAVDYDGVVDALDNFTESLKQVRLRLLRFLPISYICQDDSPLYPLTSRLPIFKRFRKSLSEFLERLIVSAAELGVLYTTDLMATIQTWITCMSSSQLRSFRHTATVVALEILTALCDVSAAVDKEADVLNRQKVGERKRKAGNKTKAVTDREKELESKAADVRQRKASLAEFLKELVDRCVPA